MTPLKEFDTLMRAHRALVMAQHEGVNNTITYHLDVVVDALRESVKNKLRPKRARKRGV